MTSLQRPVPLGRRAIPCLLLAAQTIASALEAANSDGAPSALPPWDTFSDTWAATDDLGRALPGFAECGPPRADRQVGIFYFLWLGAHVMGGPHDVTKILAADPDAMQKPDSPLWGPLHAPHHWGESHFGYYRTDDPFVLRKHAQMLSDAGVDVVIFDVTNQVTYRDEYRALLRVFAEVRADGGRTPQVAFLCPFWDPRKVVHELFADLYEPGLHPDLWYRWEGKPLILADPARIGDRARPIEHNAAAPPDDRARQILEFFTFRAPQPDYFKGPVAPGMWSWLEVYPQHLFANARGEPEQMSVGVAQNAVGDRLATMSEPGARGRSYRRGGWAEEPDAVLYGYNLAEQWERALAVGPQFVFVTGWNEWIAGRFGEFNGVRMPVMFVDQFDQEHSRDIEPMRGGHGDNYYYQLISYIRRYKGVRPPPAAGPAKTIAIDGDFAQWADVTPEFRDDIGDTAHRDHPGYNDCARYVNRTGRNDIVLAKAARDERHLYFYARTRQPLTPHTDPGWMLLFLDTDGEQATGWAGYDFVINRTFESGAASRLERWTDEGDWAPAGTAPFRAAGNELHLAVARADLGLHAESRPLALGFKWADNPPDPLVMIDLIDHGDTAPNARFRYRYVAGGASGAAAAEARAKPIAYQNPVIEANLADPAVILHDGVYHLYATGEVDNDNGYRVYTSTDLVHWERGPVVFRPGPRHVWAPDVWRDPASGRFYLYYTASQKVGVAEADGPLGPFTIRRTLFDQAIDAHLFRDDDGRLYLYFVQLPGFRITVQPMASPTEPEGAARVVIQPESDWETRDGQVTEGPWMIKHAGRYYLLYSGSGANTPDYAVGYATADHPLGPFTRAAHNPIVARAPGLFGPGHGCAVQDAAGNWWHVYHQKRTDRIEWPRFVCLDPLWFDAEGRLHGRATRGTPQPGPISRGG